MKDDGVKNKEGSKKKNQPKDPDFDKERAKLKKFDARGVQTLFRTLSRNHYNLLKMVDSKASIVLTINSILISLLMGALYIAPESDKDIIRFSTRILLSFSMLSMVFALFSMLPHRYISRKFRDSDYNGSLYASNFARQSLTEFQKEFERIMSNGETLYNEMIKDLYFLGRSVDLKQKLLIVSVIIFLIGLFSCMFYIFYNGI